MSYSVRTELSYDSGGECATVIRGYKLRITKSDVWRVDDVVEFKDWVSTEHVVQEDFIPVPKPFVIGPGQEYPVGTEFKWSITPYRYCIAIQELDCVKQVENAYPAPTFGQLDIDYQEIVFKDFNAWKESIPKRWVDTGVFSATMD